MPAESRAFVSKEMSCQKAIDSPLPHENKNKSMVSKITLASPPEKVQKTLQNLLEAGCETRLGGRGPGNHNRAFPESSEEYEQTLKQQP